MNRLALLNGCRIGREVLRNPPAVCHHPLPDFDAEGFELGSVEGTRCGMPRPCPYHGMTVIVTKPDQTLVTIDTVQSFTSNTITLSNEERAWRRQQRGRSPLVLVCAWGLNLLLWAALIALAASWIGGGP